MKAVERSSDWSTSEISQHGVIGPLIGNGQVVGILVVGLHEEQTHTSTLRPYHNSATPTAGLSGVNSSSATLLAPEQQEGELNTSITKTPTTAREYQTRSQSISLAKSGNTSSKLNTTQNTTNTLTAIVPSESPNNATTSAPLGNDDNATAANQSLSRSFHPMTSVGISKDASVAIRSTAKTGSAVASGLANPSTATSAVRIGMVGSVLKCLYVVDLEPPELLKLLWSPDIDLGNVPHIPTNMWTFGCLTTTVFLLLFVAPSSPVLAQFAPKYVTVSGAIEATYLAYFAPNIMEGTVLVLRESQSSIAEKVIVSICCAVFLVYLGWPLYQTLARFDEEVSVAEDVEDPISKTKKMEFNNKQTSSTSIFVERYGVYFDGTRAPHNMLIRPVYFVDVFWGLVTGVLSGIRPTSGCVGFAVVFVSIGVLAVGDTFLARPVRSKLDLAFMGIFNGLILVQSGLALALSVNTSERFLKAYDFVELFCYIGFFVQLMVQLFWKYAVKHRKKVQRITASSAPQANQTGGAGGLVAPMLEGGDAADSDQDQAAPVPGASMNPLEQMTSEE